MTESMIVEAVRAAGGSSCASAGTDPAALGAADPVADPAAVTRFQTAMGASGPTATTDPDPIPLADEASAAWRMAQENRQGILHRIRALSQLERTGGTSIGHLMELQYEVMNLAFQQEIVTKVADKSSTAIQTLVKNQ